MRRALSRKNLWEALPRPLRATAGAVLGLLPTSTLLGGRFRRHLRFARQAQGWSADRARAYQLDQLRRVCLLAYERTAFYRRQLDSAGFHPDRLRTLDDLRRIPMIDRRTVLDHGEEMRTVPPGSPGVDRVTTGGTGGEPLAFYMGAGRSAVEFAYLVASWERAGYRLGTPLAVFRGRVVDPDRTGLRHEHDAVLRQHYYSTFHMSERAMQAYLDHVRGIGPCFLHVYPSSADALARFLRRTAAAAPPNIRGIIAESEIVYPPQRALAEEVFGCRYFSCYGHTEKLIAAAECAHSTDYHVWATYGYTELIGDDGDPVTEPGEEGELVGTGFMNPVMPFIRYRTGDRAVYAGDRCAHCGRWSMLLRDIRGHRVQETLVGADGNGISWTAMNMHDDTFDNVVRFQFRQDAPGVAVLCIVPGGSFAEADRRRILARLERKLTGQVAVTLELADDIPLSPRGKAIYVDQRIATTHHPQEVGT
jgi:phenylacetate-CoA ligase